MAIMEAIVNQSYYGQLCINRFHYVASGTPAAVTLSFALLSAMGLIPESGSADTFPTGTLGDAMENVQVEAVQYVSSYARDLYSVTDFYEIPYATPVYGDRAGAGLSPAMATGFSSSRVRTDIRRGQKRFVGLSENDVDAGGNLASTFGASLTLMADALSETLTFDDEGNTLTFVPAVLGFEEYETESGKRAYKKYADPAVQLSHTAQGMLWTPYTQARTQVSRQYGRGV